MTAIDSEYARLKALANAASPDYKLERNRVVAGVTMYWLIKNQLSLGADHSGDAAFIASAHDMMALIERLMAERKETGNG